MRRKDGQGGNDYGQAGNGPEYVPLIKYTQTMKTPYIQIGMKTGDHKCYHHYEHFVQVDSNQ